MTIQGLSPSRPSPSHALPAGTKSWPSPSHALPAGTKGKVIRSAPKSISCNSAQNTHCAQAGPPHAASETSLEPEAVLETSLETALGPETALETALGPETALETPLGPETPLELPGVSLCPGVSLGPYWASWVDRVVATSSGRAHMFIVRLVAYLLGRVPGGPGQGGARLSRSFPTVAGGARLAPPRGRAMIADDRKHCPSRLARSMGCQSNHTSSKWTR